MLVLAAPVFFNPGMSFSSFFFSFYRFVIRDYQFLIIDASWNARDGDETVRQ